MYNIEVPLPIPLEDIPEIWRPLYIHPFALYTPETRIFLFCLMCRRFDHWGISCCREVSCPFFPLTTKATSFFNDHLYSQ